MAPMPKKKPVGLIAAVGVMVVALTVAVTMLVTPQEPLPDVEAPVVAEQPAVAEPETEDEIDDAIIEAEHKAKVAELEKQKLQKKKKARAKRKRRGKGKPKANEPKDAFDSISAKDADDIFGGNKK